MEVEDGDKKKYGPKIDRTTLGDRECSKTVAFVFYYQLLGTPKIFRDLRGAVIIFFPAIRRGD